MALHFWCDGCQKDRDLSEDKIEDGEATMCAVCNSPLNSYDGAEERECKSCGDTYEYDPLVDPEPKAKRCDFCVGATK